MSSNTTTLLPVLGKSTGANFLGELLHEQSQLSAVEQFSSHHLSAYEDVAEPAQAKFYQSLLPATAPSPGQQYSFEVDLDACSGCKACVVACHTLNGLEEVESWRRVGTITIGEDATEGQLPQLKHITTACHHCSDPGCLSGCPVKAYVKDPVTGIVKHLDDQCIGCKYCTMMCPYEVPTYSERLGIVRKCDMCQQRLSVGEAPACVQSCPNAAIAIRLIDIGSQQFSNSDRLSPGAPRSNITQPSTRYVGVDPQRLASAKPQDHLIDHPADSHWPLAIMLVATQASVGVLLTERIVSLILLMATGSHDFTFLTLATTLVAFGIAAVGMGVAPLHLGQPLRAWRVFLGLRTSWLSREAVLFGKFMGLLAASSGMLAISVFSDRVPAWMSDTIPAWAPKLALGSTLVFGILGLLSSGMIYVATRRQLWRMPRTMTRFIGSAIVLGVIVVATVCSCSALLPTETKPWLSASLFACGAAVVAAKFGWEWKILLGPSHYADSKYDLRSRQLVRGHLTRLRSIRAAAALATIAMCVIATGLCAFQGDTVSWLAGAAACGTAITGEFSERLLYFKSVVFDRMPGAIQ